MRVSENTILKELLGFVKDEVAWRRRKLRNEEVCDILYTLHLTLRRKNKGWEMGGKVTRVGETRNAYKILV